MQYFEHVDRLLRHLVIAVSLQDCVIGCIYSYLRPFATVTV